jgi:alpha-L-rhamnosidase
LYRVLAGLSVDETRPGYRHIRVSPHPDAAFSYAYAGYAAMVGPIRTGWRREENSLIVTADIPPNTTATVRLPGAQMDEILESGVPIKDATGVVSARQVLDGVLLEVGSGMYQFRYPSPS